MSSSSALPQYHSNVSVLCQLIGREKVDTSLWLRAEMLRLVHPMLNSLFLRLIMSPSLPSVVPYCHSTVAELVEREKEETNRLIRGEMDRLVNSLFLRLTNKLLMNTDWDGSGHVGDRSQVVIPSDNIQSLNTEIHQSSSLIAQTSTLNSDFLQPHSIGQEEYASEIITEVKRGLEVGKYEMTLENVQDNTTQTNHYGTRRPSTDNNHLFYEMDSTLGDGQFRNQPISDDHQTNGQVNNSTDNGTHQDWDEPEIEEEEDDDSLIIDEQMIQVEEDGDETEIDSDNDERDNENEYRLVENARTETVQPHPNRQTQRILRRSVRNVNRKQSEVDNQKETENEDEQVDDESSQPVKRTRIDTTQPNNAIGEEIATECTTNLIQPNLAQPNLQCPHCHKSFIHQSRLQRHLRVHTGERSFQCDLCGKLFSDRKNLARHQLIHQNIKNFRCSQCKKQFTRKNDLDRHHLTHSGERPFECRHCEMSFTASNNRNRHERAIHLHVKPYRCKQCGHTATVQSNLITHIRVVHFGLLKTIKEQRALNIIDERDPRELIEKV